MDGCTCAYTPNKLGLREWVSGLQINKPACCANSQLDAVFASGVQAPLKLPIGGFLSSLLSHSDMSHYSYVLAWWNAGLLWQNSAWIRKPACQKSLISLQCWRVCMCWLTEPRECKLSIWLYIRFSVCLRRSITLCFLCLLLWSTCLVLRKLFSIYGVYFEKFTSTKTIPYHKQDLNT